MAIVYGDKFESLTKLAALVEGWLSELSAPGDGQFASAFRYAFETPGKRFRPASMLLVGELLGVKANKIKELAIALELLHCSSLVHDDLPALDNDSLRRGRPTVHVKFGEAVAILVGDGLIAESFKILGQAEASPELISKFGETYRLLCEGQVLDLDFSIDSWEKVKDRHLKKTAAMIELAVVAPAYLLPDKSKKEEVLKVLSPFGRDLGVLFQLVDDVRDATRNAEALGKSAGLDSKLGRVTALSFLGLEECRRKITEIGETALQLADNGQLSELKILVEYILSRL